MPTNNQEKWWSKRFTIQPTKIDDLCLDSVEAFDAVDNGKPVESFLREELESFLRQEIRQAKIESWEECKKLFDQNLLYTEMDDAIQEAISNLKKQ